MRLCSVLTVLGVLRGVWTQYEWRCAPLDPVSNRYNLPDLDAVNSFQAAQAVREGSFDISSSPGTTYIYLVNSSQLTCSGKVTHLHYCYSSPSRYSNLETSVVTLSFLTQNGTELAVTHTIDVRSTPSRNICFTQFSVEYCCDTTLLSLKDQFPLPSSDFAYGISIPSRVNARLVGYNARLFPNYTVEQYISSTAQTLSGIYTLNSMDLNTHLAHKHLGLEISPFQYTTISTVHDETTSVMRPSEQTTPATRHIEQMTDKQTTVLSEQPSDSNITTVIIIVAAIGGGLLVLLAMLAVIVIIGIAMNRSRTSRTQRLSSTSNTDTRMPFSNPIFSLGEREFDHPTSVDMPAQEEVSQLNGEEREPEYLDMGLQRETDYVEPDSEKVRLQTQLKQMTAGREQVTKDNIQVGIFLGSDEFGEIHRGVWVHSRGEVDVAIKSVKNNPNEEEKIKFLQEAVIMCQFNHSNVVKMHGVVTEENNELIVLELLTKGNLRKHLLQMRPDRNSGACELNLDGHVLLSFCRHMASGMEYLSGKKFIHRDLAARNILISEDGICKIADFGMSRNLLDQNYYRSRGKGKIPVKWTAPEALHYKKYSTASDVWSFGMVMYEIWSVGHKPFESIGARQVLPTVDSGYRPPPPPGCPRAIYSIMMLCWSPKPEQRPQFPALSIELSYPDSTLLRWSDQDRAVHSEASKLGSNLEYAANLYRDLQWTYIDDNNDDSDYSELP